MKLWVVALVLIAVGGIGVAAIVAGIGPVRRASLTTDTHSSEFAGDQAKIQFLQKYLELKSEIDAAEFHIRFNDGSDGWLPLPAPSDYEMRVVMKVPRDKLDCWTTDLEPTDKDFDISWGNGLLPKYSRWAIQSRPRIFTRGTTLVAVFDPEGIVFKSVGDYLLIQPDSTAEAQTGASFSLQPADATPN